MWNPFKKKNKINLTCEQGMELAPFYARWDSAVEDMKGDIRTLHNAKQITGVIIRDIISPYKSYSTSDKMFEIHFEEKQNV